MEYDERVEVGAHSFQVSLADTSLQGVCCGSAVSSARVPGCQQLLCLREAAEGVVPLPLVFLSI